MRKIIFLVLAIPALSALLLAENAATYKEARVLAAKTGKPILMDFMTEW